MRLVERPVDTPTVTRLKGARRGGRPYLYVLTEDDLAALRSARLSLSAAVALACIKGAVRAAPGHEWVTLTQRTVAAIGRDARWWHGQTQRLERAGFIECERHRGRMPRYRLRAALDAHATADR
jgi:hypothetical protein